MRLVVVNDTKRSNMDKWLELSLDNEVPVTLMIMSRIFTLQHIPGQDATDMLKDTISTIGDATTKEMLVEKGGVNDPKLEKEIIDRQQQLIADEEKVQEEVAENVESEDNKESEVGKKRIKDLAESVETLTMKSAVDSEKADLMEIKEKLQEISDETEALWKELKDDEMEKDDEEAAKEQQQPVSGEEQQQKVEMMMEEGKEEGVVFDIKEDEIKFVDVNKEMKNREKAREKLEKRINKMVDKQVKMVEDTEFKFVNTLKKFHEEEKGEIDIEQLKAALNETLHESKFSDGEIEKFWNELKEIKEKQPDMPLLKRIEVLIDEYEEDIDIKDIKKKDKDNKD